MATVKVRKIRKRAAQTEKKPEPTITRIGWVYTIKDIAIAFQVTEMTVRRWITQGMPQHPDRYDLIEIAKWWFYQEFAAEGVTSVAKEKAEFDRDLKRLKYNKEKLQYEELKGRLVPIDQVQQENMKKIMVVKKHFGAMPEHLAPVLYGLEPKEISRTLKERINEILEQFSK